MSLADEHGEINTDWATETDEDYRRACAARQKALENSPAAINARAIAARSKPIEKDPITGKYEHRCCGAK